VPQERIPPQIRNRQSVLAELVVRSKTMIRDVYPQLYGDVKPRAPSSPRQLRPGRIDGVAWCTYDKTLSEHHRQWINDALDKNSRQRESRWTESIAVGSKAFIEQTKEQLGFRAKGRSVEALDEVCALREANRDYDFAGKNSTLRPENAYLWDDVL
jgi:hypothetical protein